MRPDSAAILWDVHAAVTRVAEFIVGLDEAGYASDSLRRSAVERQLEIVGEALNNLRKSDPDTAQRIPEISRIIGLRNILAHGYAVVDDSVVWGAASQRAPQLLSAVAELLAE